MNDDETRRARHELPEIGLTVDLHPAWPILSLAAVGAAGIYQPVADSTGIVFIRYGPAETVDRFVQQLGGMLTNVALLRDDLVTFAGKDGRHVTVRMTVQSREIYRTDAEDGISHMTLPRAHIVISVVGFVHRGVPILVGYRLPEEALENYRTVLDEIVSSVALH